MGQSLSNKEYEIIVVDNRSTDNTKEIVDEFSDLENIRYVYESYMGMRNNAKKTFNRGFVEVV